jgi:hypothetical protein
MRDENDIIRDGERIRVPLIMTDGRPASRAALPPGVTILADGSVKQLFDDGSAVIAMAGGGQRYLDAAGNPAHSLTLLQQAHSAGAAGRADLIDRHAKVAVARADYQAQLGNAWR